MIILNVFFDVAQEHEAEFLALLNTMVVESNKEQGCSMYEMFRHSQDPYLYTLVEHWDSQEELDAHGRTKHWIHFNDTVNDFLKSPYDEHHYTEISF